MNQAFRKTKNKYHIRSMNTHLLDVYGGNYYMELGVIDLKIIDQLLDHQKITLSSITYYDSLNSGVGKITDDVISDVYYQLNYLLSIRQRSSTSCLFLTCGCMRYFDDDHCEKYAPIVLIPVELNYQTKEIICSGEVMVNKLLIWNLLAKSTLQVDDHNRYISSLEVMKINNVKAIDNLCTMLANDFNTTFDVVNYLTVCRVAYDDFNYDKSRFTVNRSMYEIGSSEVMKQYYQDVKGILSMNLIQKYTSIKAHNGENFCVNGKLGSGKTRTIINIIGDFVINKKKVLYVNQDIDALQIAEKTMNELGLAPYIRNLTYSFQDDFQTTREYSKIPCNVSQTEILNYLDTFDESLSTKIHGFTFRYILENMAILKNENPNIVTMNIETSLERYEVEAIYKNLQDIEKILVNINPYKTNLWRNLQITHNNITINELIERTKNFFNHQVAVNQYITNFCKTFKLQIPTNITDLYRLTTHFTSFLTITPLIIWKEQKTRDLAKSAINEIQILSTIHKNMNDYYTDNVIVNYTPGRAAVILSLICSNHLLKDGECGEIETEDGVYINRLLAPDAKLNVICGEICDNVEQVSNIITELKDIFGVDEITPDMHNFFSELVRYLENNLLCKNWVQEYLAHQSEFIHRGIEVLRSYTELIELRELFLPFIEYDDNELWYQNLLKMSKMKHFEKEIRKYFSPVKVKKNKKGANEAVNAIKRYVTVGTVLNGLVDRSSFSDNIESERSWESFLHLYQYLDHLSNDEKLLIKKLFKRYITAEKQNIPELIKLLKHYLQESARTDSICTQLRNYKMNIETPLLSEKCERLKEWEVYLKVVSEIKKELRSIFIPSVKVDYHNLIELVANDKKYLDSVLNLTTKEKAYKKVLGIYYKGFQTNTVDIYQTIEHFGDFVTRLVNIKDIDKLMETKKFSQLLATINPLTELYNEWFVKFRAFSICFKKGQSILQSNSILDNVNILEEYINKINQIDYIVFVNNSIDSFLHYHLDQLANDVQDDVLVRGIADRYMYSVLSLYQNEVLKEYPYLNEFATTMESMQLFVTNEANYCEGHLIEIRDNALTRRDIHRKVKNICFNNYEEIIENEDHFTQIFMADLNVFNSDISLQRFDLVIIDDAHLSSANEYNRLNEAKQIILFGDGSFHTSVTNNIMQRINNKFIINYDYRYLEMTNHFENDWATNNCYFYSPNHLISCENILSFAQLVKEVAKNYQKNPQNSINILVNEEQTSRDIYTALVKHFETTMTSMEIINLLNSKLHIIRTSHEAANYVDDVYVYYNDYHNLDNYMRSLVFKNYVVVAKNIHIFYMGSKISKDNQTIEKEINQLVGKSSITPNDISGIAKILLDKLKEKGIKAESGFGVFDIYIKTPLNRPNYAIVIEGKTVGSKYSFIDDYQYYYQEYQKHNWRIKVLYTYDLIDHLDDLVDEITKEVKAPNEENR